MRQRSSGSLAARSRPRLRGPGLLGALLGLVLVGAAAPAVKAAALDEIGTANAAGRTVFLVLTDAAGTGLAEARATAAAAQALTPASQVVELNRTDPAQAPAVTRYRVAAAPVPLVLVIASNGVAAGAAKPAPGAAERLAALVPTPRKAETLKHFEEKKIVLLAFSHARMAERAALFEALTGAAKALEGRAASVLVDLDDPAEQRLLAERKVQASAGKPVVFVLNAKGQTLGRLEGAPSTGTLVVTAKKPAPCCADGTCQDCGK